MTLERRTGLVRTPLAARTVPLKRTSKLEPGSAPARRERPKPTASSSSPAAFPGHIRFLIRVRALDACEACGIYLPTGCGDMQHRVARGMGGSRNPALGSASNGVLLCRDCHSKAEARDPEMHAQGFWLWSYEDPAAIPIMLHSVGGSRITVWLVADGSYSTEAPEVGAA